MVYTLLYGPMVYTLFPCFPGQWYTPLFFVGSVTSESGDRPRKEGCHGGGVDSFCPLFQREPQGAGWRSVTQLWGSPSDATRCSNHNVTADIWCFSGLAGSVTLYPAQRPCRPSRLLAPSPPRIGHLQFKQGGKQTGGNNIRVANGITVRCCCDARCRQCTGKRLSRIIWSSFNKARVSHLFDITVAGPTARRDNLLASTCEYTPFRYSHLNVPDRSCALSFLETEKERKRERERDKERERERAREIEIVPRDCVQKLLASFSTLAVSLARLKNPDPRVMD